MTTTLAKRRNDTPSVSFGSVVDNIFQNGLRHFFDDNFWDFGGQLSNTGGVPVNVRETDQQYELHVVAPGCKKEDFNIDISNNRLTVSFESKMENNKEENGWSRNEYLQRSFTRSFMLGDSVDANKIGATYTDGILRLTLPKHEKAKKVTREIEIK